MRAESGAAGLLVVELVLERSDGFTKRLARRALETTGDELGDRRVTRRNIFGAADARPIRRVFRVMPPDVRTNGPRLDFIDPTAQCRESIGVEQSSLHNVRSVHAANLDRPQVRTGVSSGHMLPSAHAGSSKATSAEAESFQRFEAGGFD